VAVEGMYPTGSQEADEMKGTAGLAETGAQLYQGLDIVKIAAGDALGDPDEVLGHHPPGAQVQVAHLAVAHLAFREPDRQSTGIEQGPGGGSPKPVPGRGGRQLDRISLALLPVAPAVQDHQDYPGSASV
jgi:hypothetical protein